MIRVNTRFVSHILLQVAPDFWPQQLADLYTSLRPHIVVFLIGWLAYQSAKNAQRTKQALQSLATIEANSSKRRSTDSRTQGEVPLPDGEGMPELPSKDSV